MSWGWPLMLLCELGEGSLMLLGELGEGSLMMLSELGGAADAARPVPGLGDARR